VLLVACRSDVDPWSGSFTGTLTTNNAAMRTVVVPIEVCEAETFRLGVTWPVVPGNDLPLYVVEGANGHAFTDITSTSGWTGTFDLSGDKLTATIVGSLDHNALTETLVATRDAIATIAEMSACPMPID
jgi:hypothetical protein